jgi:metal-dependent amidase/aminoacylase/carboxypeptidase family protein
VKITTNPGYLPSKYDGRLTEIYRHNAGSLIGDDNIIELSHSSGCTDMGDVSQIMPTIQPTANATSGNGHGIDYLVENYDLAVIKAGKAMGMTVVDLLADDGAKGRKVAGAFNAPMTISEYLSRMRGFRSETTYTE